MEEFEEKLKAGRDKIFVADHMLMTTYSLLKDPKILLSILDNISLAYESTLSAFLQYERLFRRISSYTPEAGSELNFFQLKVMNKYGIKEDLIEPYVRIRDILKAHKDSNIEFSRNGNYIIANDDYDLTKISAEEIKKDIKSCKDFQALIEKKIKTLI